MADKVTFELVSPSALVSSEEVDMVVVPGSEGDFGVLPGHTPFLTTVRPGIVDIHNDGVITKSLFVEAGFSEATPERCTVLADHALDLAEITPDQVEAHLNQARAALDGADEDGKAAALARIDAAEALAKAHSLRA